RRVVDEKVSRPIVERARRWALRKGLTHRSLFAFALGAGRLARPLLPASLAAKVPSVRPAKSWPSPRHVRRMLALNGCVQPVLAPNIDASLACTLDRVGISLVRASGGGCCGAIGEHLGAREEARSFARRNIDAWWPHIEKGAEALIVTASGCGVTVKDYEHLLRVEPQYADKAQRVSQIARDPVGVIADEWKGFAPLVA